MLINGRWAADWHPVQGSDREGRFLRQPAKIRHWIHATSAPTPANQPDFPAEAGRYHLYVAMICPWACRTLAVRSLKKLEKVISVSVVSPVLTDQGWQFENFSGATVDHLHGFSYLHQLYTRHDPEYTGRATVPVLWDKQRDCMVNNESADIMRMLGQSFVNLAAGEPDLCPENLRPQIDQLNLELYQGLNNGVYRAGFATSQQAYDEAFAEVFATLDRLEQRLKGGGLLFGDTLTESDIRLFVTLVRFDSAYYGLFKCNRRQIVDYPQLSRYLAELYAIPELRRTVNFAHIKHGYYSIRRLNPSGIVPQGPELGLLAEAS